MRCWTDWSRRVQRPIKLLNTSSSKLLCWRKKLVRNSLSYDKLVSQVVNIKCSSEKMRTWTTSLVLSAFQVCFGFSKTELVKVAPFHCLVVCGYFEAAYSEIKKHEWREDPMAQRDHENAIYDASPLVGEKCTWEGCETMILHECVTTFLPLWDSLKNIIPSSLIFYTGQYQWMKVLHIPNVFKLLF